MNLKEEPVRTNRRMGHLDEAGDIARHDADAQDHQIDRHFDFGTESERVRHCHSERVAGSVGTICHLDRWPGVVGEAHEDHAGLGRVDVVRLLIAAVCPDVSIEVVDRGLGVLLADLVGGLQGGRAADPRAVRVQLAIRAGLVYALDLAAPDAVDEGDGPRDAAVDLEAPVRGALRIEHSVNLRQGQDSRRATIAVFPVTRLVVVEPSGHDDGPHLDLSLDSLARQIDASPADRLDAGAAASACPPVDGGHVGL